MPVYNAALATPSSIESSNLKSPKITKIEVKKIEWEIEDCAPGGSGMVPTYTPGARYGMSLFMTRLYTDAGITGEYPLRIDISGISDYLIGLDALNREKVWKDLKFATGDLGAAVDILLWDIAGKLTDMSISQLLGGSRNKLPAYASSMNGGIAGLEGGLSTPASYADFAQQCYELGYPAFKIHPYPRPVIQDHVDVMLALGERVGGKMDLMLDAFGFYPTFADALKVGRACDEAGFFWIEDPYFEGGASELGHSRLREYLSTPLLQGETLSGISSKMNLLISGATDFIRGQVHKEGITGTMKLAAAAESIGADIEIHGSGPAQRHAMSAIGNSNYYEMVWVHPDIQCLQTTPDIYGDGYEDGLDAIDSDGNVTVPAGPGMGIEWNWEAIDRMTTATKVAE